MVAFEKPDVRLQKVNFYHFRFCCDKVILPHGGITVAFRPATNVALNGKRMPDLGKETEGVLAASICSSVDMYCKKLGRIRALGRTGSKKYSKLITIPATYDELIVLVKQFAGDVFDENSEATGLWDYHAACMEPDMDFDLVLHTRKRKVVAE